MTIWQLASTKRRGEYAIAGLRGTWLPAKNPCKQCNRLSELGPPLVIEWEAGSDLVGDFVWAGVTIPLVTEAVCAALRAQFTGFEGGRVEMIQNPRLTKPTRRTKGAGARVWLPYAGPELYHLRPTAWVHMDAGRTTARLVRRCSACGDERYELEGVEQLDYHVDFKQDPPRYELQHARIQRAPGQGLHLSTRELGDSDLFGVHEFSGWVFCTDRAKRFIEENRYTNVGFREMGEAG